jgi:putative membrane-bound dehydrogenase-like protein
MSPRFHRRCALALLLLSLSFAQAADRPKLTAEKWSADLNVPDPVACSVDDQGRVFVAATTRRKVGDLDIREWTQWIPDDQSLQSIDDKTAFYHRILPPGPLKPAGPLKDANGDGSIDWKDLTVPTERLYRLIDSNGDGKADQITTFAEDFNTEVTGIAAGVMAFGGSVYSTIAPDVWRLVDKDGDGKADTRESIAHGFGIHIAYAGHDMHGLRIGPDGRVYWSIGDKGVNVTSREGRKFSYPNEGCVLRCEPDGSRFEVFAHGLRNVQETDFNEVGDLFGVDNDADKPGEKERLVFITEGSDSGWRCNFQYMKGDWNPWTSEGRWQPDHAQQPLFITPPIVNSHDGPAGFVYNPGTALAPAWRGWFFLDQFPSGKMNALRLEPVGAAWKLAEDVQISSGIMGIGMSWGPEGKLYFADWMGGYPLDGKGAVWTLDTAEADRDPLRAEVRKQLHDGFESLTPEALRALLAHADVRMRKGGQFELAKRGAWAELLSVTRDAKAAPLARLHAVWGLGQGLRWGKWVEAPALVALAGDADSEVRAQTAKILGEGPAEPALSEAVVKLIKDANPRVRFHAALACARLKPAAAIAPLLDAIREHGNGDPWLRHALVTGLAGCAKSSDLAAAAREPNRAVRLACLLALARNHDVAVADFLDDADPRLAAEAAIAIHDDLSIPDALPRLAAWLAKASAGSTEPALRRAVNANFRLGTPESAARLAAFALGSAADAAVREEALTQLMLWTAPPLLDHTDGRYRKLAERSPDPVRTALQSKVEALLALQSSDLRALGLELLLKYKLQAPTQPIVKLIADANIPPRVRLEGLRLLAAQDPKSPELAQTLDTWLKSPKGVQPAPLRGEALRILAQRDASAAFDVTRTLLDQGEVEEQQAAWGVLATLGSAPADALIAEGVNKLAAGRKVPGATQLDLLEAAAARAANAPTVAAARDAFEKLREAQTDPVAAFNECLEGGDAETGREIALMNVSANCVACHRFAKGSGSEVGPPLEAVASRHDRRYLLESLINPSAQVVLGYGFVTVTKKNGEAVAGTLLTDDAESVRLRLPDGQETSIPRDGVTAETPAVSMMPPMNSVLTRRQIRDVVAYLATLKPASKSKKAPAKAQE